MFDYIGGFESASDAETGPGPSTDPLSSVTSLLRVRPQLQKLCRLDAQWASDHPPVNHCGNGEEP